MSGNRSAHPSARLSARPAAPYARALVAALLTVTALIAAANAGPAADGGRQQPTHSSDAPKRSGRA